MKVTILVAVYNTEKYLSRCIDSLLSQTHTDLEILCVDDCSTDSSLSLLIDYAYRDPRVRVIPLSKNQGQAVARNIAIEQATGDLYCFLDSDDWFVPDSVEKAVQVFCDNPEADCVLFRLVKATEQAASPSAEQGGEPTFRFEDYPTPSDGSTVFSGHDAFVKSLDWSIHGVYMTTAALQKSILYDDTCRSYSDDNTTRLHYLRSRQVCLCEGIYYYRQNPLSVSHVADISRFNFLRANEHMQQMLVDMDMPDDILNLHEQVRHQNLIGCYLFYCEHRSGWSLSDRRYAIREMRRIWKTIDRHRLNPLSTRKFGYRHCLSWGLFRLQEEVFWLGRKVLKK